MITYKCELSEIEEADEVDGDFHPSGKLEWKEVSLALSLAWHETKNRLKPNRMWLINFYFSSFRSLLLSDWYPTYLEVLWYSGTLVLWYSGTLVLFYSRGLVTKDVAALIR